VTVVFSPLRVGLGKKGQKLQTLFLYEERNIPLRERRKRRYSSQEQGTFCAGVETKQTPSQWRNFKTRLGRIARGLCLGKGILEGKGGTGKKSTLLKEQMRLLGLDVTVLISTKGVTILHKEHLLIKGEFGKSSRIEEECELLKEHRTFHGREGVSPCVLNGGTSL